MNADPILLSKAIRDLKALLARGNALRISLRAVQQRYRVNRHELVTAALRPN